MSAVSPSHESGQDPAREFGPNEWLVDELYQQFVQDPKSVDKAWQDFFADYKPQSSTVAASTTGDGLVTQRSGTTATAAPAQRAPAREQVPQQTTASPAPSGGAQAPPAEATPQPTRARHAQPASPAADSKAGPDVTAKQQSPLKGAAARVVTNMAQSLEVPTATSVRALPAKLLVDNRIVINNHLKRTRGGKISFTHVIGYAVVKAAEAMPEMNSSFTEVDGKPTLVRPEHVNLGIAIDLQKSDGSRTLVVPSVKTAEAMDFAGFLRAYEDIIRKARTNKLTIDDFAGTTISLTNPGMIGTVHSVPRLMKGQGCIVGVGAMEYPAEFQGAAPETLTRLAVSKIMTLTSTYDHRIIGGAQSGEFLRRVHELLLSDSFWDGIFRSLRVPTVPIRWAPDLAASHEDDIHKQARVFELIHAFRVRGHLMADTNPLEYELRSHPDLDTGSHGLTLWDLDREFATGATFGDTPMMKLRDILGILRNSYCRTVGIEYMHIQDPDERKWIQDRVERKQKKPDRDVQLRILNRLNVAEAFETFLQTKYVGQKRFSLEGAETLIPVLDAVVSAAGQDGLDEVVIGMSHRGRLNALANIVGKSYAQIFREFEGNLDPKSAHGSGDVKYHLGADGEYVGLGGEQIAVSLVANPSHLEAVDPVLEGVVRAKQDIIDKGAAGFTVLPLLVHGDAAFAGQGVVAETLNLSGLRGYRTGGSVHVVVNNQLGFTTDPSAARSSVYCTDVARMVQAPIFHVNADDPEACTRVARLAFEYRQRFHKDVVIDLVCYRRRGHNEGDDPSMTQPQMYDLIDGKRSTRKVYTESLVNRGDITIEDADASLQDYRAQLERVFKETREAVTDLPSEVHPAPQFSTAEKVDTAVPLEVLKKIGDSFVNVPEGFTVHSKVLPVLQRRAAMTSQGGVDWATAELFAFGTLLLDGYPVRMAGQDSRRGTFVQRHAVVTDRHSGAEYSPLKQLEPGQAPFYIYDSLLSEYAAMGFEYGYSVANPKALVAWEAQFGDFVNGAQMIVDEFISSAEQKWAQRSGVALLLPHGYEGQGPDHSSARIERFLTLCAQDNMTVVHSATPSNYFHLLRQHTLDSIHRPLIVFTPKQVLRLKAAASPIEEFTTGTFRPVIGDGDVDPAAVRRLLLCSSRIYYDLVARREKIGDTSTAIARVEQLYPLPTDALAAEITRYGSLQQVVWVQDEPANMGAWPFMALHLPSQVGDVNLVSVTRPASSSPAAGSHHMHAAEQQHLLETALPEA
ncbi:MAG: multifunctional oxoglutarate decarboxylase/oxoglutarate dehydrogenase thiamine pyrophosphate-binding subunit/dihydrolipoyllysine-residue succinyltransferase subunit [Streptosporangiales bacterium]|nr:multifunctional oxoglutarate decarboxylase/oxoglutarate dehydrogenase thiamine pyrophosphate-binding subunit/dihydrolipoyllysine-residue succinyltransferase subunit [Streptosporangiales bacterium]